MAFYYFLSLLIDRNISIFHNGFRAYAVTSNNEATLSQVNLISTSAAQNTDLRLSVPPCEMQHFLCLCGTSLPSSDFGTSLWVMMHAAWSKVTWNRNSIWWVDGFLMAGIEWNWKWKWFITCLLFISWLWGVKCDSFDLTNFFSKHYLWCFISFWTAREHRESNNVTHVFQKCKELPQR